MNVAQLKLLEVPFRRAPILAFPRSNERGSIEALPRLVGELPVSRFPRSNERGSIEACRRCRAVGLRR